MIYVYIYIDSAITSNWGKPYNQSTFFLLVKFCTPQICWQRAILYGASCSSQRHLCVLLPLVRAGTAFRSSGCRHQPTPQGTAS